ncbi:hypothetical protein, partial [Rhizobium pisi]|uniref:hypothetical protein n=1 Tax=Rhizobium pisi TaxID=574561 RepID=UPI003D067778
MTVYNEFLRPDEVIKIVSNLTVDDEAFIVGGQATFLWAGFYETVRPELEKYKPFTSKDIDYYGGVQAAEKLAEAIGGEISASSGTVFRHGSFLTPSGFICGS